MKTCSGLVLFALSVSPMAYANLHCKDWHIEDASAGVFAHDQSPTLAAVKCVKGKSKKQLKNAVSGYLSNDRLLKEVEISITQLGAAPFVTKIKAEKGKYLPVGYTDLVGHNAGRNEWVLRQLNGKYARSLKEHGIDLNDFRSPPWIKLSWVVISPQTAFYKDVYGKEKIRH